MTEGTRSGSSGLDAAELHPSHDLQVSLQRFLLSVNGIEQVIGHSKSSLPSGNEIERIVRAFAHDRGITLSADQETDAVRIVRGLTDRQIDLLQESSESGVEPGGSSLGNGWAELTRDAYRELQSSGIDPDVAFDIITAMSSVANHVPPTSLLYSSLLVTAVSSCEVYLGEVMRTFLRSRPQALSGTEVKFAFSDLNQFSSIDSLKEFQIDRQVDGIIRQGGIDEWIKWFDSKLHVGFAQVTCNRTAIREAFQRRHVHVHSDGEASRAYLAKMSDLPDPPDLGDYLEVDEEYLSATMDQMRVLCAALAVHVGRKLQGRSRPLSAFIDELEDYVVALIYGFLRAKRYSAVVDLVHLLRDDFAEEKRRSTLQVNSWIARSRLGDQRVIDEVRQWDTSALNSTFQLAQLVLAEDYKAAYRRALDLIGQDEITEEEYAEWPLFAPLRERYP